MKKLLALIKTKGKSKKQIAEEAKAILKRKGLLDKDDKLHVENKKQNNGK